MSFQTSTSPTFSGGRPSSPLKNSATAARRVVGPTSTVRTPQLCSSPLTVVQ